MSPNRSVIIEGWAASASWPSASSGTAELVPDSMSASSCSGSVIARFPDQVQWSSTNVLQLADGGRHRDVLLVVQAAGDELALLRRDPLVDRLDQGVAEVGVPHLLQHLGLGLVHPHWLIPC